MSLVVKHQSPLKEMFRHQFFRLVGVFSVLIWLATVILPSVRVLPLIYGKTAVPLHYNIHIGVDTVGPWWRIYFVPVVGLLVIVINLLLARYMWNRDQVLAFISGFTTLLLQLVLLLAMIFMVYLSLQYA